MVLTAPGIPLRLSVQTPSRNWCEFTVPHGFEFHPLRGKACGEGSKDFITPTQALEAGKRQALGTEALIKVKSWSTLYCSADAPWADKYCLSPRNRLPSTLRPLQPQNHYSTQEHSSEPAAPEHPRVEAPEGPIPLVFTHPGQVCK